MNQQLIEQYVAGRLSESEAEAFEEYCLDNPEFARQVEMEQRLKAGLAHVARGSTAEFVRENHGRWKIALAASVLLFMCAGAYLWQRSMAVRPHILTAAASGTSHSGPSLRLALVRGAENLPELPQGVVRVEIVGLFEADAHYSVVLDHHTRKTVETVAALFGQIPSSPVKLEVLLDGDQLESGTYSLHVTRKDSQEDPLDFEFVKP
jgi:hypothetical protein